MFEFVSFVVLNNEPIAYKSILLLPFTNLPMLLRLNKPHEAMEDAERAKKFNPQSSCVIMAKAESFYNMGKFEMALGCHKLYSFQTDNINFVLVQYYRARKVRHDGEIESGMEKCRSAILNVVGGTLDYNKDIGKYFFVWKNLEKNIF